MKFEVPVTVLNVSDALREQESMAPKSLRALLIQAADELDDYRKLIDDAGLELELAASLRVGAMDSESKAMDVSKQVSATIRSVAQRMRDMKPRTVEQQAVI